MAYSPCSTANPALGCGGDARGDVVRRFAAATAIVFCAVIFGASAANASTTWMIQATVNPTTNSGLAGVSCPSTTACTAVGSYNNGSAVEALAERWNGSSWATQTTANPSAQENTLSAVSCASTTVCTAVGMYFSSVGQALTLAERWNGTTWSVQPTPNPPSTYHSGFSAVSCPSITICTAVGFWTDSFQVEFTLAERWNGTTWTIQSSPALAGNAELSGVSCASTTACTSVGSTVNGSNVQVTLAEKWSKSGWAVQATPNPTGASGLNGVSCPSSNTCTAVGQAHKGSNVQYGLAERWGGTSWTIQATPVFSGNSVLTGVSCPSATACTAVGWRYNESSTIEHTLAERWNGTSWAAQSTPNKTATDVLTGVSCPSTTAATAVGFYESAAGDSTLAEKR